MNELPIKNKTLTSLEVAEMVEKNHNELLKDIRRYINQFGEGKIPHTNFFLESSYKSTQNKDLPCYLITKKGCEFIANKLTGKKGTIFTATYINRFNEMEQVIKENIAPIQNLEELKIKASQDRAKAMLLNAQNRMLKTLSKVVNNDKLSPIAVEVLGIKSMQEITGNKNLEQYLPQVPKTYSATEIGNILGVTANKIGSLAKSHNLKTEENGMWVMDKSKYSNKEVSTFRYFENAINVFKGLLA